MKKHEPREATPKYEANYYEPSRCPLLALGQQCYVLSVKLKMGLGH